MMRANSFAIALILVLGSAGAASAQSQTGRGAGSGGPIGVGVHAMLIDGGPFGPAVVYDTGMFHVEGILGFSDNDNQTRFDIGGRFWYHINASQAADFSLGGGLGVVSVNPEGEGDGTTDIEIDAGGQLRVFLVPNVSLSAALGLVIVSGDNDFVALTGDFTGSTGLTYFF